MPFMVANGLGKHGTKSMGKSIGRRKDVDGKEYFRVTGVYGFSSGHTSTSPRSNTMI